MCAPPGEGGDHQFDRTMLPTAEHESIHCCYGSDNGNHAKKCFEQNPHDSPFMVVTTRFGGGTDGARIGHALLTVIRVSLPLSPSAAGVRKADWGALRERMELGTQPSLAIAGDAEGDEFTMEECRRKPKVTINPQFDCSIRECRSPYCLEHKRAHREGKPSLP